MSSLFKRVFTAVIGIPVLLLLVYWDGLPFFMLVLIVGLVALYEYAQLWRNKGINCNDLILYFAGTLLIVLPQFDKGELSLPVVFAAMLASFSYHGLRDTWRKGDSFLSIGLTILGLIYIAWPISLLTELRSFGFETVLLLLVLGFGSDTAAYFVGINFGRRRLAPTISPKKSWEGAIGALIFTGLLGAVWSILVPGELSVYSGFFFGVIASLLGQVGDLIESMVKRYCGVKDSGLLLPGHGGLLDRLDSILLIIPFIYLAAIL